MKKVLIAGSACAVLVLANVGTAFAHHPEVTTSSECARDGVSPVVIDTEAWSVPDNDRRVNHEVDVSYKAHSAPDWTHAATGSFDYANDFKFTVRITVPHAYQVVDVRVQPLAGWGPNENLAEPGGPRDTSVTLLDNCRDAPAPVAPLPSLPAPTPPTFIPGPAPVPTVGLDVDNATTGDLSQRQNARVLALTGRSERPTVLFGTALLATGAFFLSLGGLVSWRHRRNARN